MNKRLLRNLYLQERKALSLSDVEQRSKQIADSFFTFLSERYSPNATLTIHLFLPIRRQNEVDTWFIINKLPSTYQAVRIGISITDTYRNTLRHYLLSPDTELIENRWGIPEPAIEPSTKLEPTDFDLVIVPLLIFDQQGQRVGYGGGFYDRFLAECRPDCLKIGVSFFEPVDQIDEIEPTDIPLNACITPTHFYWFGRN